MKANIKSAVDNHSVWFRKNIMEFSGERVVEGGTPERIWLDHVARYEFAGRYVKRKHVLDIACGTGYGCAILCHSKAKEVIGGDIASETVQFAYARYKMDRLKFKVCDILNIDFPENYFDVITCFETIEHVKDQEKGLIELRRVLKSKGLLIISSPNRKLTSAGKSITDPPNNPFHVKEYSTKEFISVLGNYFEILQFYGQRGKSKFFFLPFLGRVIRNFLPSIYNPGRGRPDLERVSALKEYRYITAVCRKYA
jgi:ubiquinone/menaquinone biosynthesis C-methylase UbiE